MSIQMTRIHLPKVSSTNSWVKENYRHLDQDTITCVTASEQTAGRGRLGRSWISAKDQNITTTYFFTLEKNSKDPGNLTQILSLSAIKLLHHQKLTPEIKWPNDILIHRKKIGGVLCETLDLDDRLGIVLGIGINVNMPNETLDTIDQPATSLLNETGMIHSVDSLQKMLDQFFYEDLVEFKTEGFTPFYKTYESLLAYKGQTITIQSEQEKITGILHTLNPDGRLNLLLPTGVVKTIHTGELSPS